MNSVIIQRQIFQIIQQHLFHTSRMFHFSGRFLEIGKNKKFFLTLSEISDEILLLLQIGYKFSVNYRLLIFL